MDAQMNKAQIIVFALSLLAIGFLTGVFAVTPNNASVAVQSTVYSCPSWVSVTRSNTVPRWSLTDCVWQDIDTSGGNHNAYISIVNSLGAPATAYAHQSWPDGDVQQLTLGGQTNFGLYGGSFDPNRGEVGAYSFFIDSRSASDVVGGVGLPLNRHVNYVLSFQQITNPTQPTLTPVSPTAPSGNTPMPYIGDCLTKAQFHACFLDEMRNLVK